MVFLNLIYYVGHQIDGQTGMIWNWCFFAKLDSFPIVMHLLVCQNRSSNKSVFALFQSGIWNHKTTLKDIGTPFLTDRDLLNFSSDGSGSKIFEPGRVSHLWFGFEFGKFFHFRVGSESTGVKGGLASYLLQVKSKLGSGQGPSLNFSNLSVKKRCQISFAVAVAWWSNYLSENLRWVVLGFHSKQWLQSWSQPRFQKDQLSFTGRLWT